MDETFDARLASLRAAVNGALERYLTPPPATPTRLWEAMAYSVLAGGKRLRPIIVLLSAEACGGEVEAAMPAACAVELAHTYSLIHDDLPAMDDDDRRRGRPTCHRAFDEATAILAGDALQTLAFEVLTRSAEDEAVAAGLVRELAGALGPRGMAIGQAADLAAEGTAADLPALQFIHRHKTAALIRACARMGGIAAGADETRLALLGRYGEKTGLAFQVIDDILDVTVSSESLGKTAGKDTAAGKVTYPSVMGLADARAEAARLTAQAIDALAPLGEAARPLGDLARRLLRRLS